MSSPLPEPRLTKILRLEANLGEAIDVGDVVQGRRRIVPLTGGSFVGPELNGTLLSGASADWQIVLADGTTLGDIFERLDGFGDDSAIVRQAAEAVTRAGR